MSKPVNVEDYRALARKRLPKMVFDYLEGGAEDETGLAHNREAFQRVRLRSRRLVDVSRRDSSITLFDKRISAPLLIAPTGLNGSFWPKGDIALARSAARFGIPFLLSTASNSSIEEVAEHADGDLWFQLYVVHRKLAEQLVRRAMEAGYSTLVLTVDVAVNGKRERDLRNGFAMPMHYSLRTLLDGVTHPRWSMSYLRHGMPQLANFVSADASDTELQAALMSRQMDATFSWDDLKWLRQLWPRKLLVKGLSRWDDAQRCIAAGADGVIFSNHGGRQLDGAVAPFELLCSSENRTHRPVLIDSGIRRGSDVVKALAAGASAVLLGRATLYGLAAAGENGVDDVLAIMKDEIDRTLAQLGCPSVEGLSREYLARPDVSSLCRNTAA
jgi:(S)-mandelate dehydrogenase